MMHETFINKPLDINDLNDLHTEMKHSFRLEKFMHTIESRSSERKNARIHFRPERKKP